MDNKKFQKKREALHHLRNEIEEWRQNKITRKMPNELWKLAITQARLHSPWVVSQFLKISYPGLLKRIQQTQSIQNEAKLPHGFVEIPSITPAGIQESPMRVHLSNHEGQSATIQYSGSSTEWANLFMGWFKACENRQKERDR